MLLAKSSYLKPTFHTSPWHFGHIVYQQFQISNKIALFTFRAPLLKWDIDNHLWMQWSIIGTSNCVSGGFTHLGTISNVLAISFFIFYFSKKSYRLYLLSQLRCSVVTFFASSGAKDYSSSLTSNGYPGKFEVKYRFDGWMVSSCSLYWKSLQTHHHFWENTFTDVNGSNPNCCESKLSVSVDEHVKYE